jgi:hypothetical protein
VSIYLFIYLFIYSNGGRVYSVIHPFDPLPPTILGFRMFKIKQCISTNGAGLSLLVDHRVCSMGDEMILNHSFRSLSYDMSVASSKASSPQGEI